jgi:hypothetical protein
LQSKWKRAENLEFDDLYLEIPTPLLISWMTEKSLSFSFACKSHHDNSSKNNNNSDLKGVRELNKLNAF